MSRIRKKLKRYEIISLAIYFMLAILFHFAAGEQLYYKASKGNLKSIQGSTSTYEITNHFTVKQEFTSKSDEIQYISLQFSTFGRVNSGEVNVQLVDDSNKLLIDKDIDISALSDGGFVDINSNEPISGLLNKKLSIIISSENGENGNAVASWYNPKLNVDGQQLYLNGEKSDGTICFKTYGRDHVKYSEYYWYFVLIGAVLILSLIHIYRLGSRR